MISLSFRLRVHHANEFGDKTFVAIPVFPSRVFRHGHITVNRHAGIKTPKDLEGKRVGVPLYTQTAAVYIRGLLQHEYDVDLSTIHWVQGALNVPGPHGEPAPQPLLKRVDIEENKTDKSLGALLAEGAIDAITSAGVPELMRTNPNIQRLFPNYHEVEKQYYKSTGVFPIMHLVAIRRNGVRALPVHRDQPLQGYVQLQRRGAPADEFHQNAAIHAALAGRLLRGNQRGIRRGSMALWRGGEPSYARSAFDVPV